MTAMLGRLPPKSSLWILILMYATTLWWLISLQACTAPVPATAPPAAATATPSPVSVITEPNPTPAPSDAAIGFKASWEKYPENAPWTAYVAKLVDAELLPKLEKAKDVTRFCPRYPALDRAKRIQFWTELVSTITYFESGWNPLSRMLEDLGTDPATGLQVASEGLLQLSYQDVKNYSMIPECGKIDWRADKILDAKNKKDPKKTILDPYINLGCGVRIMAHLIGRGSAITTPAHSGAAAYWSVLRENRKLPSVLAMVKKAPVCL